jgi:hypothetical protein
MLPLEPVAVVVVVVVVCVEKVMYVIVLYLVVPRGRTMLRLRGVICGVYY